ncbi:PCNA-associated factor [Microcaecilia unicolor]|uniref:PCNA-associated factor n=1 Tax=Microcaecilia unicolor TaxID=1415580 RepID=A0A6P7WYL8_9AMPH|nr:PCNA-associated factor [Microcaecilia unicolor]
MVRTKADGHSGSYRKAVAARAPRKTFGSSTNVSHAVTSPSVKKAENKYAGGNPVCVRPTPTWQKKIGEFFASPSQPEKENCVPSEDEEEAGSSGLSKAQRKSRPLLLDPAEEDAGSEED